MMEKEQTKRIEDYMKLLSGCDPNKEFGAAQRQAGEPASTVWNKIEIEVTDLAVSQVRV